VTGGDESARQGVAAEFHQASPLASGPVVRLDARRDDAVLRAAIERWIAGDGSAATVDPLTASAHGTLFIDHAAALGRATQRLLLMLAQQPSHGSAGSMPAWGGRLVVGSPLDPVLAVTRGSLLAELFDCLDKIRVDLDSPRARRGCRLQDAIPPEDHGRRSLCG
jgi:DNA-binding NtrC family response regulator